jgi:hypothetical protein
VISLAALLAAVATAASSPETDLRIAVWPEGRDGDSIVWRLRCNPPGGTLPNARTACRRLLALRNPFEPVPENVACIEIYGGPQEARVVGTFRGRRIWVWFRRTDGCEIGRWNRHAFLFPTG